MMQRAERLARRGRLFRGVAKQKRAREEAEAALRESETRFARLFREFNALLDAIPDNLTLQSPELKVIWANRRAAETLGNEPQDLVGMRCYQLFYDGSEPCPQCPVQESFRTGAPAAEQLSDHRGRTWELRAAPIRDEDGAVVSVVEVGRDVTSRVQAEAERERIHSALQRKAAELEATIASIPDAVIIYGPQGEIIQMNTAAEGLFGYPRAAWTLPFPERSAALRPTGADGRPLREAAFQRALRGEIVENVLLRFHSARRKAVWVSASAAPIRAAHGALLGAVEVFKDITVLHELQESRDDFVRMVSHDLRTPLASIGGFAQLLLRKMEADEGGRPEVDYARVILSGTRRMNAMIRDLVDSVRLEAGQMALDVHPVALSTFVPEVLEQSAGALEVDRVRVTLPADLPPVLADPERLARIVLNLVGNALKYSPAGTDVHVEAERREGEATVSVTDRGSGIAAEDLPRLFDRFFRADRARKAEGLGLGLYISRMLVEAQGGRIWVTSEEERGSTFHFTLPFA